MDSPTHFPPQIHHDNYNLHVGPTILHVLLFHMGELFSVVRLILCYYFDDIIPALTRILPSMTAG